MTRPCCQEIPDLVPAAPERIAPIEEIESKDALDRVASALVWQGARLMSRLDDLAVATGNSRRHLLRSLHALAANSLQSQEEFFSNICQYLSFRKLSAGFDAMACIHHVKYDETPMLIRGCYGDSESAEMHTHVGKFL